MFEIPGISNALQVKLSGSKRQRGGLSAGTRELLCPSGLLSAAPLWHLRVEGEAPRKVPVQRNRTLLRAEGSGFREQINRPIAFSQGASLGSQLSPARLEHRGILAPAQVQLPSSLSLALPLSCLLCGDPRQPRDTTVELCLSGEHPAALQDTQGLS